MPKLTTKALTDTRIQRAKVKRDEAGNPVTEYLWDATVRGFGLRVTPQGGRSFCMKFRDPQGKQAWIHLGPYTGEKSLDEARAKASEYRTMLGNGLDPRIELKKAQDIPTFKEFVKDHLERQEKRLKPSSYRETKRYLDKVALPELGGMRVHEIQQFHIDGLLEKFSDGWRPWLKKGVKVDPTPTAANRFRAALSKLFAEVERKGLRAQGTNPVKLVEKRPEVKSRERYLTKAELKALGKELKRRLKENAAQTHPDRVLPYAIAALRLLLFTGARLNEVLGLQWSQIDKKRGVIRISEHKTSKKSGVKELPINSAVLAIIQSLEKSPNRKLGGQWVIQGKKHGTHLVGLQKIWEEIREKAGLKDVRIHDLRHTFASFGMGQKMGLPVIGNLLGHSQPSVTARYAHLDTDPRLQASETISAEIASALG